MSDARAQDDEQAVAAEVRESAPVPAPADRREDWEPDYEAIAEARAEARGPGREFDRMGPDLYP